MSCVFLKLHVHDAYSYVLDHLSSLDADNENQNAEAAGEDQGAAAANEGLNNVDTGECIWHALC